MMDEREIPFETRERIRDLCDSTLGQEAFVSGICAEIARAIMAERDRAAIVAEQVGKSLGETAIGYRIAIAIRTPSP